VNITQLAVLLNSALYLGSCVAAGLAIGNPVAWRCAIADVGLLYLGYLVQLPSSWEAFQGPNGPTPRVMNCWLLATIILGAGAGVALLF
jgi:hypothetical protein